MCMDDFNARRKGKSSGRRSDSRFKKDQNSYRTELGGQLAITTFAESVDVPQGEYYTKTVCDGLATLNKVGISAEYIKCSAKHVDMIFMILEL